MMNKYKLDFHYSIHLLFLNQRRFECVIDVGVGNTEYLEFWRDIFDQTIGFEPNQELVGKIHQRFKDDTESGVSVHHLAAGETTKITELWINKVDQLYSTTDQQRVDNLTAWGKFEQKDWKRQIVEMVRLDDLNLDIHGSVDLIKSDSERHEVYVLEGARKTIEKHRPLLQLEHVHEDQFESEQRFNNFLKECEYEKIPCYLPTKQNFYAPKEWNY